MKHSSYNTLERTEMQDEEFFEEKEKKRFDRTSFVLFGCAGLLLLIFVVTSLVAFVIKKPDDSKVVTKLFEYDDMFDSKFQVKKVSLNWWNDTTLIKKEVDTNNIIFSSVDGSSSSLLVNSSLVVDSKGKKLPFSSYLISPNADFILLAVQTQKSWRHSFTARYLVYDTILQKVFDLTQPTDQLSNVRWSPRKDRNVVAFVRSNNIFMCEVVRGEVYPEYAVTQDGSFNEILNGIMSWVYEEEVFSDYNALWWNDQGNKLAYMKSNESLVPEFSFPMYEGDAYTKEVRIKYPKAGYTNPTVSVLVFDFETNNTLTLDTLTSEFDYIYSVQWYKSELYLQLVPRIQNIIQVVKYDISHNDPHPARLFSMSSKQWVEVFPLWFYEDAIFSIREQDDYNHLAKYSLNNNQTTFLTSGKWSVISIITFVGNNIYYVSTEESSVERHVYRISSSGSDKTRLTNPGGWYSATFSPNGEYYVLDYLGPSVPTQTLFSTKNPEFKQALEVNQVLKNNLAEYKLPKKEWIEIPSNDNQPMNAFIVYPPNFDKSKKYPLLMHVYGGPGSQNVHKRFDETGFNTYLASQMNYIVASVDGRGTGAKSNSFMKVVYKNLGHYEAQDQLAGASYFKGQSYIDPARMAIWGWSYGGYMTTRSLAFDTDKSKFKCGISVAPVTSWLYYDSVYTERYMETPQTNPIGYDASSVLPLVANISDGRLLLIHGTGDDNVHWQNAAELSKELITKDIQFETMAYPNYDHSITARRHLYRFITNFLVRKFA